MNLLNKYVIYLGLLTILLSACRVKTVSEQLFDYAKEQNIEIKPDTKVIIVLSNKGCIACNQSFSNLCQDYLNQNGIEYILTANGGLLDIRPFLSANNVSFDKKQIIHKKGLIKSSGVFFLNEEQNIDTLVNIEAKDLQKTLSYINQRLFSLKK